MLRQCPAILYRTRRENIFRNSDARDLDFLFGHFYKRARAIEGHSANEGENAQRSRELPSLARLRRFPWKGNNGVCAAFRDRIACACSCDSVALSFLACDTEIEFVFFAFEKTATIHLTRRIAPRATSKQSGLIAFDSRNESVTTSMSRGLSTRWTRQSFSSLLYKGEEHFAIRTLVITRRFQFLLIYLVFIYSLYWNDASLSFHSCFGLHAGNACDSESCRTVPGGESKARYRRRLTDDNKGRDVIRNCKQCKWPRASRLNF